MNREQRRRMKRNGNNGNRPPRFYSIEELSAIDPDWTCCRLSDVVEARKLGYDPEEVVCSTCPCCPHSEC